MLDAGTITPHADLSALIDENGTVTAGEQEVTVKFLLPASVDQVNVVTVQVHLTQLAASNTMHRELSKSRAGENDKQRPEQGMQNLWVESGLQTKTRNPEGFAAL